MEIKVGYYRNRKGQKVEVTHADPSDTSTYPIVGRICDDFNGTWRSSGLRSWNRDGREFEHRYSENDLITPWEDPSEIKESTIMMGDKFQDKSGTVATVIWEHEGWYWLLWGDMCRTRSSATATMIAQTMKPYRPQPLKIQGEFWADGLEKCEHRIFEFMANRTEKSHFYGAKKYLFTVEEVSDED